MLASVALGPRQAPRRDADAGHRVRRAARPGSSCPTSAASPSTSGPGLFTGLRVGVASGKAMAQALRVPMIGVSSLDLLAFPLRFTPPAHRCVIDARRGEVFYACYRQVPGGVQRLTEPAVGTPDDLASELLAHGRETPAGRRRRAALRRAVSPAGPTSSWRAATSAHPSARSLVQLAHARRCARSGCNPWDLEPLYLRKPDAEINWTTRDGA